MSSQTGNDASHEDQDEEDGDQATTEFRKLERFEFVRVELESHVSCNSLTAVPVVMWEAVTVILLLVQAVAKCPFRCESIPNDSSYRSGERSDAHRHRSGTSG